MVRRALLLVLLLGATAAAGCVSRPPTDRARPARRRPGAAEGLRLPFTAGTCRLCVQAGPGLFSHQGKEHHAVDFLMPVGTPVRAAREGTVIAVKEDSHLGAPNRECAPYANFVVVQHPDGTRGVYYHLMKNGACVDVGQVVRRGECIGRSGNTGWTAFPHLHFHVEQYDPSTHEWPSIPLVFEDVAGDGRIRLLMGYESGNHPPAGP